MAFARVYVGAHYPGDVVAGVALGTVVAAAGYFAVVPVLHRLAGRLTHTPLRRLLTNAAAPTTPPTTPEQV